ncbi:MAG: SMP-30/gluconolactonase/LRE family protein [Desulfocapsaceae bacterium]
MFTLLDSGPYECGETPNWVKQEHELYWVDAASHKIFKHDLQTGSTQTFKPDVPVSALRIDSHGNFFILSMWGLYRWSPQPAGSGTVLAGSDYLNRSGTIRFNDGIDAGNGLFIAGAFDKSDLYNGNGYLFLLDTEGMCRLIDNHLFVPNGIALSKDKSRLFMSEMYQNRVLAYEVDWEKESFSKSSIHITITEDEGKPDGLLCDSSNNLWVAHWRGWRLTRYDKNGNRNKTVNTPFASPTCPCFAEKSETALFVSTATLELTPEELEKSTNPGGMFKVNLQ